MFNFFICCCIYVWSTVLENKFENIARLLLVDMALERGESFRNNHIFSMCNGVLCVELWNGTTGEWRNVENIFIQYR